MCRLTFWQNAPSIHQAPLMRELGKKLETEVLVIAEDDISDERKQQGWERPDYSPASLHVNPDRSHRKQILDDRNTTEDVHIFSGFHAYPETYWTFRQATQIPVITGAYLEAGRHNDGIKSYLRQLRYGIHALRWGSKLDYIFAIGELGVRWYQKCGFPQRKLVPYGYFVNPDIQSDSNVDSWSSSDSECTIAFVGKVIRRKGIDVLINSLGSIKSRDWCLRVVGEGEYLPRIKKLADDYDINSHIQWVGTLDSYADVRAIMRSSDLLVLPSRYDGWGAVVNEALHEGTPVITTEACGAADLIRHEKLGVTVPPANVGALSEALKTKVTTGRSTQTETTLIKRWADNSISPSAGADYLIDVLKSEEKVKPPWRGNHELLTKAANK